MSDNNASKRHLSVPAIKGVLWIFAGKGMGRFFQLIKLVVLARFLNTSDIGLFGIVLLTISTLNVFTQAGFDRALIQKKGDSENLWDTVWTVKVIRSVLMILVLYFSAPLIALLFKEPRVTSVLRVMSVALIFEGLANVAIVNFEKKLEFHKQFIYFMSGATVSLVVGVVLAIQWHSVWALVAASIAGGATHCVCSYLMLPYRPRLRFNLSEFKEVFNFGKWLLGSNIVAFLSGNCDDAFVGRVLGAASLGIYQIAFTLANTIAVEVGNTVSKVVFPVYSKIQDESERLRRAYILVFRNVLMATLPLGAFVAFFAPEIVHYTLGSKWAAAAPLLPLLSAAAMLRVVVSAGGTLFLGKGKTDYIFWMNFWRLTLLLITIIPLGVNFGLLGVCYSVLISLATMLPFWIYYTDKTLKLSVSQYFAPLWQPAITTVILLLPAFLAFNFFKRNLFTSLGGLSLGIVLAGGFVLFSMKREFLEMLEALKKRNA